MREISTVERMVAGVLSGDKRWLRWAVAMRGEYIVRWRRVRSLILSRLLLSEKDGRVRGVKIGREDGDADH